MSDLKPEGFKVAFGGQEMLLLLTIGAIDEIQSKSNMSLFEAMSVIASAADGKVDKDTFDIFRIVMNALLTEGGCETLTDEEFSHCIDFLSYRKIARAILRAYGVFVPEPDEDGEEVPNRKAGR